MSARSQLRAFFLSNVGKIVNSDELRQVAGNISEWARRVRELRDEEGYNILSHNDRGDLKPGQYILEDPAPEPKFERNVSKELRAKVLDRNGFTCQICGAGAGEPHPTDATSRTRLHLGHIKDKSLGGEDSEMNLHAVCSVCNEGASNITPDRPSRVKLVTQIRRAARDDQLYLRDWLLKKYPMKLKDE
ncbi:MAG: HNH endonuclease signature motif containing protein [Hyphomicrobium aestuarii]|nr:HNH endonuclease signature motif containing protein [Hyphomicrobium aestuarii]